MVTFRKVYRRPGEQPVKRFSTDFPGIVTNSMKGTLLDDIDKYGDKIPNTAPMKMRLQTLRKHGREALRRTFK